jgi:uncharacterized membrane protein YwaF
MPFASIIFWLVFVVPLVAFLVWLMRQDKRKGKTGLFVLIVMVVVAIVYMYVKNKGQ